MNQYEKKLPNGVWFYINSGMPADTTDLELQQFLAARGIDLPLENISVRQYGERASAKISVTREAVHVLVNWAINGEQFRGFPVKVSQVVSDR